MFENLMISLPKKKREGKHDRSNQLIFSTVHLVQLTINRLPLKIYYGCLRTINKLNKIV